MSTNPGPGVNLILVGAGLNNGLLAWVLRHRRPELRIQILEAGPGVPAARTWSFHDSDIADLKSIAPFASRSWSGYDICFPGRNSSLNSAYHSIQPSHFQSVLQTAMGENLRFHTKVRTLEPGHVILDDGTRLDADCVIDGRGQPPVAHCGFQKFVGLRVELREPHQLTRPILMDARVNQIEGFRFMYVLPWSPTELLIEDTRYSNTGDIHAEQFLAQIRSYAKARQWQIVREGERESAALPIPLQPPPSASPSDRIPRVGTAGGFFHPVTGYSLPDGARLAIQLAALNSWTPATVNRELCAYARERAPRVRFYCLLNRMMFFAAPPDLRYKIFAHFYRLPEPVIQRFYQGSTTLMDRMRILSGRPPVPVWRALQSILQQAETAP